MCKQLNKNKTLTAVWLIAAYSECVNTAGEKDEKGYRAEGRVEPREDVLVRFDSRPAWVQVITELISLEYIFGSLMS